MEQWLLIATAVAAGKFASDMLLAGFVVLRAFRARKRHMIDHEEEYMRFQQDLARAAQQARSRVVEDAEPTT